MERMKVTKGRAKVTNDCLKVTKELPKVTNDCLKVTKELPKVTNPVLKVTNGQPTASWCEFCRQVHGKSHFQALPDMIE
ncbi:hypothetical protein AV656_14505 [Bhargavaea cecembensis]|uniref:Uncharacterized protein n=1 Tax=Bhargavaea cecembensis TaxID=394098 RepID=A0A165GH00_9BACL|nr:hypothetical protein [Bhargavaea cecembensis]KZE36355.1 hypothetical protein AV656_14505 [Bhargavaea cecembensis]